jgi:hydrogenase maturation protease
MTAPPTAAVVIIGIGNPMRRDDGVGPAALVWLEHTDLAHGDGRAELITLDGEPTRLLDAWRGRRRAIVIDAARSDARAGSIHRVEVGHDPLPGWATGSSSHSAGLAEAVALGRTLDLLPEQLIVFGVEAGDLALGEGLSGAVLAALPALVEQVASEARR